MHYNDWDDAFVTQNIFCVPTFNSICDRACENRARGHTKFDHFSNVSSVITLYFIMV